MVKVESIEINDFIIFYDEAIKVVIPEVFNDDCYKIQDIPKGSTVIDIGAHIGTFTLRCAKERGCKVYAYEPCPRSYRLLIKNVEENNLTSNVETFQKAIGGKNEKRPFYTNPEHTADSSFFLGDKPDFKDRPLIESIVETVTLEQIFKDNKLTNCDILKIDCEGAEKEIFSEQSKTFFKNTGYVVLEWHSYDGRIYRDYLSKLGFSTHLTGCGNPPPPYEMTIRRGYLYAWNDDLRERE